MFEATTTVHYWFMFIMLFLGLALIIFQMWIIKKQRSLMNEMMVTLILSRHIMAELIKPEN